MSDAPISTEPTAVEAWWKLKNTQVDTIVKIVSTLGIVGALIVAWVTWAGQKSQVEENGINGSILDLKVSVDATKLSGKKSLAFVNIDLVNKGKRSVHPYAHTDDKGADFRYSGEGLTLSVTRHKLPVTEAPVSAVKADEERVVERYNILQKKYSYSGDTTWDNVYTIKPSNNFRETETIVLNRGFLYEFVVRFYGIRDDEVWTNTETKYVYIE